MNNSHISPSLTVICAAVSLGCVHDDLRSEPGSCLVVGMIPIVNGKSARRAGCPADGPGGYVRRKLLLFHQCYSKLLDGWNTITKKSRLSSGQMG